MSEDDYYLVMLKNPFSEGNYFAFRSKEYLDYYNIEPKMKWEVSDVFGSFNSFRDFLLNTERKYEGLGFAAIKLLRSDYVVDIRKWGLDPFKKEKKNDN